MTEPIATRFWPESTIVCIAGGPSLTPEDVNYVRGKARVIAINDAYKLAPWADAFYACDAHWWGWHPGVQELPGLKFSLDTTWRNRERPTWLTVLRNTGDNGIEPSPLGLRTGRNSGYQALNLAIHLGASKIVLLGYDMSYDKGGPLHWFGSLPSGAPPPVNVFLRHFNKQTVQDLARLNVSVVNCTRKTALTIFPQAPLEEVL